ncbi:hypothetical protein WJX73_002033 [Symbiochloris irregularis]|uniref:Uncharacterized protein n=1 Tax=Symbiochloris irregularis TaxID=706552 RepID=A0AAW1NPX5_9CHLO
MDWILDGGTGSYTRWHGTLSRRRGGTTYPPGPMPPGPRGEAERARTNLQRCEAARHPPSHPPHHPVLSGGPSVSRLLIRASPIFYALKSHKSSIIIIDDAALPLKDSRHILQDRPPLVTSTTRH